MRRWPSERYGVSHRRTLVSRFATESPAILEYRLFQRTAIAETGAMLTRDEVNGMNEAWR